MAQPDWADEPHPPTDDDGPVMVIHVLEYRAAAEAAVTPEQMDAYSRAAAETAARRGTCRRMVRCRGTILGDGRKWDQVRFDAFASSLAP